MQQLPPALQALDNYKQFILWTTFMRGDKLVKLPVDWRTRQAAAETHTGEVWLSFDEASAIAQSYGPEFGVGFVFTENDPFFFVDIDNAWDGEKWSDVANTLCSTLSGAAVEISQSGTGLHIIGSGVCPEHACKNIPLGLELYTEKRFVALTGAGAHGDSGANMSHALPALVQSYYPPKTFHSEDAWTSEPVPEWSGLEDDTELIAKALSARSAAGAFGGGVCFKDLWERNDTALSIKYPDPGGDRPYDGSSADAALAQHLAFWTGKDCERIRRLMDQSELKRDKWEREDYLVRTITRACALQEAVYSPGEGVDNSLAEKYGAGKMKASSAKQREYAESIRAGKLAIASEEQRKTLARSTAGAKFYIDNADRTPEELVQMLTPVASVASPLQAKGAEMVSGFQYQGADLQLEHFDKCVYVQGAHKIFTPTGAMLKPDQFNATYGGYVFQLDESGAKTTRKAWEAFTESQIVRFPKAATTCFRPELETGKLVEEEGVVMVNTYVPVVTDAVPGDVQPFLSHLAKLLPGERDRQILLSYMAACVQYPGVKFQWAPLIQGVEGNGKTLFTRCIAYAVGKKYTHLPPAHEMTEKFNDWLFHKLFIGVEEVLVPESKREVMEILKPMITNDRLAMRAMQQSQVMGDNRANFLFCSNHKDAIRKTRNDRRFAVFYTSQQNEEDLARDSMNGDYFPDLYGWLGREGGYASVNYYLRTYQIAEELNPAKACHRAPVTSSHNEAISSSLGMVEQAILDAVEEGRVGFAGGWVSSTALDNLLSDMGRVRVPINKRREMMRAIGYDWHPALKNGRVNNALPIDGDKKSKLYIRDTSPARELESAAAVAQTYEKAQRRALGQEVDEAAKAFGG